MLYRSFVPSFVSLALLCAAANCAAQTSFEVLYIQQNTTLLTYTVDPATLQATVLGQPLVLSGNAATVRVIPSPKDDFLYVLTGADYTKMSLSVYATDSSGAPQTPALQTLGPAAITELTIDPNGKFAYMVEYTTRSEGALLYTVHLFRINALTGELKESPQVLLKYGPSSYCAPSLDGFYPNGGEIEYSIFCTPSGSLSETFYKRTINSETGEWGPSSEFYSFDDNNDGINSDEVRLSSRSLNDLNLLNTQTSVRIYPPMGGKTPLIDCTSTMLAACGEASQFWQDISGQYLFLSLNGNMEIVKVDLASKRIVDTGSSINLTPNFSPDDAILYGVAQGSESYVQIYGFNKNNGGLTLGDQITVTPTLWNVFPALRE
jgi:hypothetical protein